MRIAVTHDFIRTIGGTERVLNSLLKIFPQADVYTLSTSESALKYLKLNMNYSSLEKAQIMFKLTRKNNWGACYDRLEHLKRFQNLDQIIKELSKIGWLIIHIKPNYTAIS